jgi:hypothetical protein
MTEITTDEYFGGCPHCGQYSNCLNVNRSHWMMCDEHRVRWWIGSNLFSSWRHEDEVTWAKNILVLEEYSEVEPIFPEPSEEEKRQMAEREAEFRRVDKGFGVCSGPNGIRAMKWGEPPF